MNGPGRGMPLWLIIILRGGGAKEEFKMFKERERSLGDLKESGGFAYFWN